MTILHLPGKTGDMEKRNANPTKLTIAVLAAAVALVGAGCSTTTLKHGQHYTSSELAQVQPGMSQDEVRMALGSPATTSTVNAGTAYYYISSTRKQTAFLDPKEVDRKIVAVYFTPIGSVERIAQYGIKDGKVFDFVNRETPSATASDDNVLKMLFRNLGKRGSVLSE
jgi:outer membrane protein assembly factor BamE (lipoprotein component of BamABCDE complex)